MITAPSNEAFDELIARAMDQLPPRHIEGLKNIAIVVEDEPTPEQRVALKLHCNQTLFGLYEGVPLPARGGVAPILPDKITLFKLPLVAISQDEHDLLKQIHHTLWHEIAHYYGLNHDRIHELESKSIH